MKSEAQGGVSKVSRVLAIAIVLCMVLPAGAMLSGRASATTTAYNDGGIIAQGLDGSEASIPEPPMILSPGPYQFDSPDILDLEPTDFELPEPTPPEEPLLLPEPKPEVYDFTPPPLPYAPGEKQKMEYNITIVDVQSPTGILYQGKRVPLQFIIENSGTTATKVTVDVSVIQPDNTEIYLDTLKYNIPSGKTQIKTLTWSPMLGGENTIDITISYKETGVSISYTREIGFWVIPDGEEVIEITPDMTELPEHHGTTYTITNGNLTVGSGGIPYFPLDDDTIIMQNTGLPEDDGKYQILVKSDGILEAFADSFIQASSSTRMYKFNVYGTLIVDDSTVKNMWGNDNPNLAGGIVIHPGATVEIRENSVITGGKTHNIYCNGSAPVIENSIITFAGVSGAGHGIVVTNGASPIIENNTFTSNEDSGIYIDTPYAKHIFNNTFMSNYEGIHLQNSSPIIENNTILNNYFGINLDCGSGPRGSAPIIRNNTISDGHWQAIICYYDSVPQIMNNTIENDTYGIDYYGSTLSLQTYNNTIQNNTWGVWMYGASPTLYNNAIYNNSEYGIWLDSSSSPLIEDNDITWNYAGIWAEGGSAPTIRNNDLISFNHYGIACLENSNALIEGNNITSNVEAGVYIDGSSPSVRNNNILATTTITANGDISKETLTSFGLVDRTAAELRRKSMILLKSARFDTLYGEPQIPDELKIEAYPSGTTGYYIVQFQGAIDGNWIQELKQEGVGFYGYIPNYAYIVAMDETQRDIVYEKPYVRWTGIYQPGYKISPNICLNIEQDIDATILIIKTPDIEDTVNQIIGLASEIYAQWDNSFYRGLRVKINTRDIPTVGQIYPVYWIEPYILPEMLDEVSTEITGGNWTAGAGSYVNSLGFDGTGIVVSIADTGIDDGSIATMHPDLAGRVDTFIDYTETKTSDGIGEDTYGHGTHCAGIVAGNGSSGRTDTKGYLYGMGMAPNAQLIDQRIFNDLGGWEGPSNQNLVRDAVANGAIIGSNSWGMATFGSYILDDSEFDAFVRDADPNTPGDQQYILVFSAGNSGSGASTIGSPGNAKNVITVGASENYRPTQSAYANNPDEIAWFSSRGPTTDGRIKPDIAAPGTWIASTLSSSALPGWATSEYGGNIDDLYEYCSGTSMACPQVSGGAAIFVQYYLSQFGGYPSPAIVKAALINGAVDMAVPVALPNYDEGWGRMNLTNILDSDAEIYYSNQEYFLKTGDIREFPISVGGPEAVKVTLAWTDPPGTPGSSVVLVNNLDLEVEAPDGTRYNGNQFTDGWSDPSLVDTDVVNNVENIFINFNDVQLGEYVIRVKAINVANDSIKATSDIDQDFALVIQYSHNTGQGDVYFNRSAYRSNGVANITIVDYNQNANPTVIEYATVNITSTSNGDYENMAFAEQHANSSFFVGEISCALGAPLPNDGILQVAEGVLINVSYFDSDDGMGGTRHAEDIAMIDDSPPVISNVAITLQPYGEATITWDTNEESSSLVRYGTSTPPVLEKFNPNRVINHLVDLNGLEVDKRYYLEVLSTDYVGNTAIDNNNGNYYTFITFNYTPGYGVLVMNSINVTLEGNTIVRNEQIGIYARDSTLTVENNTISLNTNDGLYCLNSSARINNNTVFSNQVVGIRLNSSTENIITNNSVYDNQYGVYVLGSKNTTLTFNDVSNDDYGIYFVSSINNTIGNNTCLWNYYRGISLTKSEYNDIICNNASNIIFPWPTNSRGISIQYSNYTALLNNSVYSNPFHGVYISYSDQNYMDGNQISENRYGIIQYGSSNNTITNNTIENNYAAGVYLRLANNNNVSHNIVVNSWNGILLYSSSNNTLYQNNASGNWVGGIYLLSSEYSTLVNNVMYEDSVFIDGELLTHWNTHSIDISNTVNGKPLYYWRNQTSGTIPVGVGEVILANCTNIIIDGQDVSNGSCGIETGFTSNTLIRNNTADPSNAYGVYLYKTENTTVFNTSTGSRFLHHGIGLKLSNNNLIENNSAKSSLGGGIIVWNSNNNTLRHNMVSNNSHYGIHLTGSDNNIISNNTALFNGLLNRYGGIVIYESNDNRINDNTANYGGGVGITIMGSEGNNVSTNVANSNIFYGIWIAAAHDNLVSNNHANDNEQVGILLNQWSTTNDVFGNEASFNDVFGIYLIQSNSNTILNNTANSNDLVGICLLDKAYSNTIASNLISANEIYGIYCDRSDNNMVLNNTISDNLAGVYIRTSSIVISNNVIGTGFYPVENETVVVALGGETGPFYLNHGDILNGTLYMDQSGSWYKLEEWIDYTLNYDTGEIDISLLGLLSAGDVIHAYYYYTIEGGNKYGIYNVLSAPVIDNNTIAGNDEDGICISNQGDYILNPIIDNNTIIGNRQGVNVLNSSATIKGNGIFQNRGPGVLLDGSKGEVFLNTIMGNHRPRTPPPEQQFTGIEVRTCEGVHIHNNNVSSNSANIYLDYSTNITIEWNLIVDASAVIMIYPNVAPPRGIYSISSQMTASNNTIWGTIFGMDIRDANTSTIICDNKFYPLGGTTDGPLPGRGVYLDNASVRVEWNAFDRIGAGVYCALNSNATISNNTITNGEIGVYCNQSSPTIADNTILSNGYGILLDTCTNTIVERNNASSNLGYGIYVYLSDATLDNNIFNASGIDGIFIEESIVVLTNNIAKFNAVWDIHIRASAISMAGNDFDTLYFEP